MTRLELTMTDRYRIAWRSARQRAAALSAELTRRAPLLGEYAAENTQLHCWHDEDRAALAEMRGTIERLRAEKQDLGELAARREAELIHYRAQQPADRCAPGTYYCDDCDHAFTAPTDTESCICSCGTRAWREKPADADLRDRIAQAMYEAEYPGFDWAEAHDEDREQALERADAVLAVLPEPRRPFDAQAGLQRLADDLHRGEEPPAPLDRAGATVFFEPDEPVAPLIAAFQAGNHGVTAPPSADRAAVLREAAAWFERDGRYVMQLFGHQSAAVLRRMADEAAGRVLDERVAAAKEQQVEAHPSLNAWRVELYDPGAEEWVPGSSLSDLATARARLANARERSPKWKDTDTHVQRRIVRETTTYTVQARQADTAGEA